MKKLKYYLPVAICILIVGLYGLMQLNPLQYIPTLSNSSTQTVSASKWQSGYLFVDVIDVGQGDSIFIKTPSGETMLIDAGESDAYSAVKEVLDENDVKELDALVATHPHSDHIGSMQKVYENYGAKKIYMSKAVTTTATYKNLLTAISKKGQSIITAKAGMTIDLDSSITLEILSPMNKSYDDLNDYSVVIKCTYKNVSVLFTGDATKVTEAEMIANYKDKLKSDVLKVGHHGSRESSSAVFLSAVSPKYAIISCGKDNSYGHPHEETLNRLNNINAIIKRTDESGSIMFISNGNTIEFNN